MSLTSNPVEVYANADPTTSYTFSDTVDLWEYSYATFWITASGTAATSFEAKLQVSNDDAAWCDAPSDEVAAGASPSRARVYSLLDEDGTVLSGLGILRFVKCAERYARLAIKRTGGDANTRIQAEVTRGS